MSQLKKSERGPQSGERRGEQNGERRSKERGIALLVVLSSLAVLTIIATDMQYNARIDATLAENGRDELIAYYNARAALEVELAILRAIRQAQAMVQQFLPGVPLPNLVGMIPTECSLIANLITLQDDDTPLPIVGECSAKAIPEKGKIDVNRLGNVSDKFNIRTLLLGQFLDPRFDRYFENQTSVGEHVTRDELVANLGDYTDLDTVKDGSSGDEDDVYARQKDRYKVKNAPFDSVAELQLVYGVNDDVYEALKNTLTVYPVGGISLTTADIATVAAVIRQCAVNPRDPTLYGDPMLTLLTQIMEMRKTPLASAILNSQGLTALALTVGIALDSQKMKSLIDDSTAMDWYTIEASGQSNSVEKRVLATFNLAGNQLVYYREE